MPKETGKKKGLFGRKKPEPPKRTQFQQAGDAMRAANRLRRTGQIPKSRGRGLFPD